MRLIGDSPVFHRKHNAFATTVVFILVFISGIVFLPAAQAQVAGKAGASDEEQVIDLTDQWFEAQKTHNTDFLRLLIADDFEAATAQGDLVNKAQLLERVGSPNRKVEQFHADNRHVRVYGNIAILSEHTKIGVTDKSETIGGDYRIVRIYLKKNDKWQCVMVQVGPSPRAYTPSK
jgi:ketosteroid isomerase-like protein